MSTLETCSTTWGTFPTCQIPGTRFQVFGDPFINAPVPLQSTCRSRLPRLFSSQTSQLLRAKGPGRWPLKTIIGGGVCTQAAGLGWQNFRPLRASGNAVPSDPTIYWSAKCLGSSVSFAPSRCRTDLIQRLDHADTRKRDNNGPRNAQIQPRNHAGLMQSRRRNAPVLVPLGPRTPLDPSHLQATIYPSADFRSPSFPRTQGCTRHADRVPGVKPFARPQRVSRSPQPANRPRQHQKKGH